MSDDPFSSSRYRLRWAKYRTDELERGISFFVNSGAYDIVDDPEGDGVHKLLKIRLVKMVPETLSGTAFDVVSNLRSALDQAIYAVTSLIVHPSTINYAPYFPFGKTKTDFEAAVKGRCKVLPKEIADTILGFKAYKGDGGNNLLWALNELVIPISTQSSLLWLSQPQELGSAI